MSDIHCSYCEEPNDQFEVKGIKSVDDDYHHYQLCYKCNNKLAGLNPRTMLKERKRFWDIILENAERQAAHA